jgi:tetratricopeptide (TPR) repeat protein
MRAVYGEHPFVASVLDRLGMSLVRLGQRDKGVPYLRESLSMRLKVLGDGHPDVQLVRVNLGRALQEEGRFAAAESLLVDALRARTAMFGAQHGAVAASTEDLAQLALARGEYGEAVRRFRAAIDIWRAAKLPQWELLAQSLLGDALARADSLDEAERVLRDALAKQRTTLAETNTEFLRTEYRLADALRRRGGSRLTESDSLFRVVLAARRKVFGPTSIQLNQTLEALARVRETMGDTASAEPFIREVVTNTAAVRPANDSTLLTRRVWLSTTLCASGKRAEGERVAREVLTLVAPTDTAGARRTRATIDGCQARASRRH